MEIVNSVFLSLGSNLGDRIQNIETAYSLIQERIGPISRKSEPFENDAEGFETDDLFINTCIQVESVLAPLEILKIIQTIELELGRELKTIGGIYESRLIDVDIIYYNDEIFNSDSLSIPHKLFRERKFVLKPLVEIAENKVDPISQLTTKQLLSLL